MTEKRGAIVVVTKAAGKYLTIKCAKTGDDLAYVSARKKGPRSDQVKIYIIKRGDIDVSRGSPILAEEIGNEDQGY